MNPTKSLCNPYVFNTAITRARSLVVAVGNPFTLLSVEANVTKPKYCWREFITRCLEQNSFIIPDSVCDRSRDIPAEIQHILVTPAVPACLNKELLPVSFESHVLLYLFMLYSSNSCLLMYHFSLQSVWFHSHDMICYVLRYVCFLLRRLKTVVLGAVPSCSHSKMMWKGQLYVVTT